MRLNYKFKVGQKVICTFGTNKGIEFEIAVVLKETYSCKRTDGKDNKYYEYDDNTLVIK